MVKNVWRRELSANLLFGKLKNAHKTAGNWGMGRKTGGTVSCSRKENAGAGSPLAKGAWRA